MHIFFGTNKTITKFSMLYSIKLLARFIAALTLISAFLIKPALAQNIFAPIVKVNDSVITQYELSQRLQLLDVLGGSSSRDVVIDALIEDKIKLEVASRAGLTPSDELITEALNEFASRGSLSADELIQMLESQGIARETLRDFVTAGTVWREYARERFGFRAQISESEIDRALATNSPSGGLRVLLSEIFLPARDFNEQNRSEEIAQSFTQNPSIQKFAEAAARYSVAPTRENSGKLDWIAINDLPAPLRQQFLTMKPGDVTEQFETGNAIGFFQLRSIEETPVAAPKASAIEFATYIIEGGRTAEALAQAADIATQIDTCEDLYAIAHHADRKNALDIKTLARNQIELDIAVELAKLDANEISTALTRNNGNDLLFLMLCGRSYASADTPDRDAIRQSLQSARIQSLAESHLAELIADAVIVKQ